MEYLEKMRQIQDHILEFLDNDDQQAFDDLTSLLIHQQEQPDKHELKSILNMISKLTSNHHRCQLFIEKILKIIRYIKKAIKQMFSNIEIFNLFKNNELILLFFIEEAIITIDVEIIQEIEKIDNYKEYFKFEIQKLYEKDKGKKIPENYHEKRRIGENDSYVCELIRNDNCVDFIVLYNKNAISLTMTIPDSIYETNPFLLGKNPTLIEYSAFFGSLEIFNFLRMNNVELEPSLWLYAIHGRNPEIIHILEYNNVECNAKIYSECLNEAIKCHHNEFAMYYKNNWNVEVDIHLNYMENEFFYAFHFYNFEFIPNECKDLFYFFYSVENDYYRLVDYFNKHSRGLNINESNNLDIFNYLLQQPNIEIGTKCFENCDKLEQFTIPSQVTSIGANAFSNCTNLKEIIISSSVTYIGANAFRNCTNLKDIIISSSVTYIGENSFDNCINLKEIIIPSSVTYIGANAFNNCTNLKDIIIPSSVTFIGDKAFHNCKCFEEIIIPSSVTSIGNSIVSGCDSLKSIQIPQNIKKIGILNFQNLIFLTEFNIPQSVKVIEKNAFYRCESLSKIEIPSSVTHIEKYAFFHCISLEEITLSSSTKSIDLLAFKGCGSIKIIKFKQLPNNIESYLFPFYTSLMEKCKCPKFQINGNTIIRDKEDVDINFITKKFLDPNYNEDYAIKAIILGGSNGEKTDFLKNILGEYEMFILSRKKYFDIAGMSIPVDFYDPSESEKFQDIKKRYYRGSDCAIILFDLTDKKSFENAKNTCNSLFEEFGQIPIILVGYKSEFKGQISIEEIAKLACEYHCEYLKVSNNYYDSIERFLDVFSNCTLYEAFQESYCRHAKNHIQINNQETEKTKFSNLNNQEYQQKRSCLII